MYSPTFHLLAFVDALGFSREIAKRPFVRVEVYLRILAALSAGWVKREPKRELKITAIGDSIVLGLEVPSSEDDGRPVPGDEDQFLRAAYHLAYAVSELQVGLAIEDIWTRGAITYGEVDFNPGIGRLLGPAFHRAYYLESTIAKYPRVIIDGRVIAASGASTSHKFANRLEKVSIESRGVVFDFAIQDSNSLPHDVPTFVDFLRWARPEGAQVLITLAEHVSRHLKDDAEHFTKYQWMAEYIYISMSKLQGLSLEDNERLSEARGILWGR
jgi:hypothetical protein